MNDLIGLGLMMIWLFSVSFEVWLMLMLNFVGMILAVIESFRKYV